MSAVAQPRRLRAKCVVCGCVLTKDNVVPFRLRGRLLFATCVVHAPATEALIVEGVALTKRAAAALVRAAAPKIIKDAQKLGRAVAGLLR